MTAARCRRRRSTRPAARRGTCSSGQGISLHPVPAPKGYAGGGGREAETPAQGQGRSRNPARAALRLRQPRQQRGSPGSSGSPGAGGSRLPTGLLERIRAREAARQQQLMTRTPAESARLDTARPAAAAGVAVSAPRSSRSWRAALPLETTVVARLADSSRGLAECSDTTGSMWTCWCMRRPSLCQMVELKFGNVREDGEGCGRERRREVARNEAEQAVRD